MTLLEFKQIKQALGEKAADVRFVFVSVDGDRDTPDKLRDYISRFDPDFFGLTGEEAILRRIAPDYNLQFEKVMGSAPDVYLVDHTATSFLLDRDGRLVNKFIFNIDPQIVADVIQARLAS
jgi:protein SCO1/2